MPSKTPPFRPGHGGTDALSPEMAQLAQKLPENAIVPGIASGENYARVGVYGKSVNNVGIYGESEHDLAGKFVGDVEVTGDIRLVNADCAEDFDVIDASAESGTVMVMDDQGALRHSYQAYDKRVAGVISGAGNYKPAIILDSHNSTTNRKPIALIGKAFCKVDAQYAAVESGDLLTTSPTPGHAMKVTDPQKAFGAVIGKALLPLKEGQALVPMLIALQ